jgi:hypothetical protein
MTARPVTYYEVVCDEPDCGVRTADLSSEYSAWSEEATALEEWSDHDGIILTDGRTYCEGHNGGKRCAECDTETQPITQTDDGWLCPSCAKDLAS